MPQLPAFLLTRDRQRLGLATYALLALLCLAFYLPGFVSMPPTDRDESLFAQASKQMIESHDYTDIHFQHETRYKKPIGIYWLQSAAVRLFNPHSLNEIWAYRLPSLAGASIAVLMTAATGCLLFGPAAGLIAALMLASSLLLNAEARLAKTDAALLACIAIAQYTLARAYLGHAVKWGTFLTFWIALAAGILIKGPIILLITLSTLLWLRIGEGNLKWVRPLKPLYGIMLTLALVMPWFIAIMMQSKGAFLAQSAGHDLFGKILNGQNRGIIPPGAYALVFVATFFPFSLFALLAIPDIWAKRHDPAFRFCLGWIILPWIVFELTLTKLVHYVLPVYPAVSILAAAILCAGYGARDSLKSRAWTVIAVTAWIIIGMALALAILLIPAQQNVPPSLPHIAAALALLLGQSLALLMLLRRQPLASTLILAAGGVIFSGAVFAGLSSLDHVWLSRNIVAAAADIKHCPATSLIATGYNEPSLVFLSGTDTSFVADGAAAAALLRQNTCRVAVIDDAHRADFLAALDKAPLASSTLSGLDMGRGKMTSVTLYAWPGKDKP